MKTKYIIALLCSLTYLIPFSTLHATSYEGSTKPTEFGPWQLYQSRVGTFWIECIYKRYEIVQPNASSKRVETEILNTPRYPYGRCPSTISTHY